MSNLYSLYINTDENNLNQRSILHSNILTHLSNLHVFDKMSSMIISVQI